MARGQSHLVRAGEEAFEADPFVAAKIMIEALSEHVFLPH